MKNLDNRQTKRRGLIALVALVSLLAAVFGIMSGAAQTPETEERKFENTLPKHIPLKVKLRNEESFKKKENKNWARELELEITNTGSKPIRYLYVILEMPDFVLEDGVELSFRLKYGRNWLVPSSVPVDPNEPPIMPGDSIVMRIPEFKWKGYESIRGKKKKDDPRKVRLVLQMIDFGDGTALEAPQGVPLTYPVDQSSVDAPPAGGNKDVCRPRPQKVITDYSANLSRTQFSMMPASFLRANFSPPEEPPTSTTTVVARDLCNCQNINDCFFGKLDCAWQCPCDNQCEFFTHVSTQNCSDPQGKCRYVALKHDPCATEFNGEQICSYDKDLGPCAIGDPTPTPEPEPTSTPTPIPTPTPTPQPCPQPEPSGIGCCVEHRTPVEPGSPPPPCRYSPKIRVDSPAEWAYS